MSPNRTSAGAQVLQAGERRSARIESLRAVAAIAVLISHVWLYSHHFAPSSFDSFLHRTIAGGGFGVQLFFALSGFLIFRPFARRDFGDGGAIDLRTYARNRAVRILPLYWCAVVVLLVFTKDGGSLTQWWRFTSFTQEFFTQTAQTVDGPMWSLVVELLFYLLLPLLAWGLARLCRGDRRKAIAVLLVAGAVSVAFRRADPEPKVIWEYSLPGTFYGFVPGMVLALLQLSWEQHRPRWLTAIVGSRDTWLVASAGVWLVTFWHYDWAVPVTALASFLTVGAVVLPLAEGSLVRALDWRPLALVGIASYSLYIWHVPIIEQLYAKDAFASFPRLLVVAVPLALAVAAVSFVVIERPALSLRGRWARTTAEKVETEKRAARAALSRDQWWLVVLAAVAFFARARMVMATRALTLSNDPADYDRLGQLLAAGKGFGASVLSPSGGPTAFRPPLYPVFLGGIYKLTGDSMTAARLVQAALGGVTVVLVFLVARRLFGRPAAFAAAIVTAVYPPLVTISATLMSEAIFVPIMVGALLTALLAREGGARANHWAVATGLLVGAGLLARPNSVAMLPAFVLLVTAWSRVAWDRRAALVRAALLVTAAVAVLVPWQIRNARTMSGTVFIADIDGYNVAGVYNADSAASGYPTTYQFRPPNGVAELAPLFRDPLLDEVSLGDELRTRGIDFVRSHPIAPAKAVFWNSFRMLELSGVDQSTLIAKEAGFGRGTAIAGMVSFWLLAACAIVATATQAVRRAPRSLWLAPALLWLGTSLFLGNARLRAPIEPFLVLAAAPLLAAVAARVRDRRSIVADTPAASLSEPVLVS
jgi:peptidoglycan/LPS O-acetylase OafA/YrhL/4-amino-4-deoxy-L-arabinose transferase-like glycosyltransferase